VAGPGAATGGGLRRDDQENNSPTPPAQQTNWRWYWIRTALITVLMFIFILWFMLPRAGDTAYLWAAGFALGIRLLRRQLLLSATLGG
jgi:hypothetical protein